MSPQRAERLLVLLLGAAGWITLLALPAMLLPTPWMAAAHRWLGLGEFPDSPLVDYLTRSIAGLYAMQGGWMLLVARDIRRYRPLAVYLLGSGVLFGLALVLVDLHAGMPWTWTLGEGPPFAAFCLLLLYLLRSVPDAVKN